MTQLRCSAVVFVFKLHFLLSSNNRPIDHNWSIIAIVKVTFLIIASSLFLFIVYYIHLYYLYQSFIIVLIVLIVYHTFSVNNIVYEKNMFWKDSPKNGVSIKNQITTFTKARTEFSKKQNFETKILKNVPTKSKRWQFRKKARVRAHPSNGKEEGGGEAGCLERRPRWRDNAGQARDHFVERSACCTHGATHSRALIDRKRCSCCENVDKQTDWPEERRAVTKRSRGTRKPIAQSPLWRRP